MKIHFLSSGFLLPKIHPLQNTFRFHQRILPFANPVFHQSSFREKGHSLGRASYMTTPPSSQQDDQSKNEKSSEGVSHTIRRMAETLFVIILSAGVSTVVNKIIEHNKTFTHFFDDKVSDIVLHEQLPEDIIPRLSTKKLENLFDSITTSLKAIEISGPPGIGKSTIALEYALNYQKTMPSKKIENIVIKWFDFSEEEENIRLKIEIFGAELGIENKNFDQLIVDIQKALSNRPNFLLIIDEFPKGPIDLDNKGMIFLREIFTRAKSDLKGQILLTREEEDEEVQNKLFNKESISVMENFKHFKITKDSLTSQEAASIFTHALGIFSLPDEISLKIRQLIDKKQLNNPSTLRQIAKLIRWDCSRGNLKNEVSFTQLKKALDFWENAIMKGSENTSIISYLEKQDPFFRELLSFLAWVSPTSLSKDDFSKWRKFIVKDKSERERFDNLYRFLEFLELIKYKNGDKIHLSEQFSRKIEDTYVDPESMSDQNWTFLKSTQMDNRFYSSIKLNDNVIKKIDQNFSVKDIENNLFFHLLQANKLLQLNQVYKAESSLQEIYAGLCKIHYLKSVQELSQDQQIKFNKFINSVKVKYAHYRGKTEFFQNKIELAEIFFQYAIELSNINHTLSKSHAEQQQKNRIFSPLADKFDENLLLKRQGIGWILLEKQEYKRAEETYIQLINDSTDSFHQQYCWFQLLKIYYHKAYGMNQHQEPYAWPKLLRIYYEKVRGMDKKQKPSKELEDKIDDCITNIETLRKITGAHRRRGEFDVIYGKIELAKSRLNNDRDKAKIQARSAGVFFKRAIYESSDQRHILATAYALWAEAYCELGTKEDLIEAAKQLEKAIYYNRELVSNGMKRSEGPLQGAENFQKLIHRYIVHLYLSDEGFGGLGFPFHSPF
ncbi:hypothetical protein [Rhabdochlamydiaceae symbiont of Dictyostelium giganteum]|uniref:hypothetical protein n=1 Tax=Rhabdochlamydiaceae symbiont of Dictyostelium giganteum TaxID=3342349 RepID=UPI00384CD004